MNDVDDGKVWIEVEIFHVSDRALLIQEMPHRIWVPFSLISDHEAVGAKSELTDLERGDRTKIKVPEWLVVRIEALAQP